MTNKAVVERMAVCARAKQQCEVCGKQTLLQDGQLAHLVPQRKRIIKQYGKAVIHDENNLAWVCSLACNNMVSEVENGYDAIALLLSIERGNEHKAHKLREYIVAKKRASAEARRCV